ncbi:MULTISPECIES: hypothetical protein [unclassified Microcoleus]|uniref:hypothetical protein n=1 Tax=unclassified Microcoleus TaxID=2642155 RepID=UPI002FCEAAE4
MGRTIAGAFTVTGKGVNAATVKAIATVPTKNMPPKIVQPLTGGKKSSSPETVRKSGLGFLSNITGFPTIQEGQGF